MGAAYLGLYLAAGLAALPHAPGGAPFAPWNAAPAISLGLVARFGLSWLPLAIVAPLLAGIADASGPGWAVAHALAEAGAVAGAALVLRAGGGRPDLGRLRTVFAFFGAAAAAAALLALAGALRAAAAGHLDPWVGVALGGHEFLANAVAILSVAPLILVLDPPRRWGAVRAMLGVETALQAAALAIIAWEVFGRFVNEEIHFFYLLFLPLAWIATRHGQRGAGLALAAVYLAPMMSDWLFGHRDHAILELQIRLGVLAMTGLLLGAMVSERRLSQARMLARQAELAHVQRLNIGWEMASALAHELNQPLTAAMNYTQAAQRLIAAPAPDLGRAAAAMARSVDQIERVSQIIHGLRDFMRKGEMRLARNDVAGMVEEALRLVAAEANAAGVALQTAGLAALPAVTADRTQIVQVLVNLARNAVQSVAAAGVEQPAVAVSARLDDGEIEIAVADNGPGLPPGVLARLFEPFVTTKEAGMGLGLSISKSIIEAHGGRLWAENQPQGGAAFRFVLPVAAQGVADA